MRTIDRDEEWEQLFKVQNGAQKGVNEYVKPKSESKIFGKWVAIGALGFGWLVDLASTVAAISIGLVEGDPYFFSVYGLITPIIVLLACLVPKRLENRFLPLWVGMIILGIGHLFAGFRNIYIILAFS